MHLSDTEKGIILALLYFKTPLGVAEIKAKLNEAEIPEHVTYQRVKYFLKRMEMRGELEQPEPRKFWVTQTGVAQVKKSRHFLFSLAF